MSAMEFKTSATATYSLATSLRVRRLALLVRGWLALDQRGPVQMNNETLISSGRSTSVTRISGGGGDLDLGPRFNIVFGVSPSAGATSGLHVNVTFYGRLVDGSALQQAENGSPAGTALLRDDDIAVGAVSGGPGATSCAVKRFRSERTRARSERK